MVTSVAQLVLSVVGYPISEVFSSNSRIGSSRDHFAFENDAKQAWPVKFTHGKPPLLIGSAPLSRDFPGRKLRNFLIWRVESHRRRSIPFSFFVPPQSFIIPSFHHSIIQSFNHSTSTSSGVPTVTSGIIIDRKRRIAVDLFLFLSLLCEFWSSLCCSNLSPSIFPTNFSPTHKPVNLRVANQNCLPRNCSKLAIS